MRPRRMSAVPKPGARHLALSLLLALCGTPALAQAPAGTLDCANPADHATEKNCAYQAWEQADKQLVQLYQQLITRLDPEQRPKLRGAQRAWLRFRDLQCAYETIGYEGGTAEPLVHASCMAELTQQRNDSLQRLLRNPN